MLKSGLYIVATPIGNLKDITLRALETLKASDLILCEDTRVTSKLLAKHEIATKMAVYNDHSDMKTREYVKSLLEQDLTVSLVSDAGTPLISDPGYKLLKYLQDEGYHTDVIPGPCSPIAALTISGLPTDKFLFLGFAPKTAVARAKLFQEYQNVKASIILFETSSRLVDTLDAAIKTLSNREAAVAREITKLYQEIKRKPLEKLRDYYTTKPPKGEIVLIISGIKEEQHLSDEDISKMALKLLKSGLSHKDATEILAKETRISKKEVYRIVNAMPSRRKPE